MVVVGTAEARKAVGTVVAARVAAARAAEVQEAAARAAVETGVGQAVAGQVVEEMGGSDTQSCHPLGSTRWHRSARIRSCCRTHRRCRPSCSLRRGSSCCYTGRRRDWWWPCKCPPCSSPRRTRRGMGGTPWHWPHPGTYFLRKGSIRRCRRWLRRIRRCIATGCSHPRRTLTQEGTPHTPSDRPTIGSVRLCTARRRRRRPWRDFPGGTAWRLLSPPDSRARPAK